MKLIIGLGNPGDKYQHTRHNIGFRLLNRLREKLQFEDWKDSDKHSAILSEGIFQGEKILLVKPQTFMNLSGKSAASLITFYKLDPDQDLLVCFDDKDLLFGKLRERQESGSGGHNGIKSLMDSLGTKAFHRLKFGVGHEDQQLPTDAFVLQKFSDDEENQIAELISESISIIENWLEQFSTESSPDS